MSDFFGSPPDQNTRWARTFTRMDSMRDNFNRLVIEDVKLEPIPNLIYNNLRRPADRSFVDVTTETYLNKKEILDQVLFLAGVIQEQNVIKKGDLVAIISENCCQFIILVFVISMLEATLAPVNPNFTEEELEDYLSVIEPNVIFCNSKILVKLKNCDKYEKLFVLGPKEGAGRNFQSLDDFFLWPESEFKFPQETYEQQARRIFAVLHTNSEKPKPVIITNCNVAYLFGWRNHFNIFVKEIYMGVMPFYHYYTLFSILITILFDMKYYFMSKFNTDMFFKAIQANQIEVLFSPPALCEFLARTPSSYKQQLKSLAILHSAPLSISPDIERIIREKFNIQIFHSYSLTESTFAITKSPRIKHNGSFGVMHSNIKTKIIGRHGAILREKSPGEIFINGMMVSPGYYNSVDLTKKAKNDEFFSTGDVGFLDEEELYITCRAENMIYLDVTNIELEYIIKQHELVNDVFIVEEENISNSIAFVRLCDRNLKTEQTKNIIIKYTMDTLLRENKNEIKLRIEFLDYVPRNIIEKRSRDQLDASLTRRPTY